MMGKILYYYNALPVTQTDIEIAFRNVGLEKGDTVMVHSDVGVFGKLGKIYDKEEFLDSILNAFLNVLGEEGTLIVPTFTYSFCRKEVFDVKNSPSKVGVFSEHVRRKRQAVRSLEPIFSCAGIGKFSRDMLRDMGNECFGQGSIFDKLYRINGKLMLFGRPFDITYMHYVENAFKVSYRFNKTFSGVVIDENSRRYNCSVDYYVRHLDRNINYKMENLGDKLLGEGLLKKVKLGYGDILLCKAQDVFNLGIEMLKKNGYSLLANLPSGAKC